MKILKTKTGVEVPLNNIKALYIIPERRLSVYKFDCNFWKLDAHLYSGEVVTLYEAYAFDHESTEFFGTYKAVKGNNYEMVRDMEIRIQAMINESREIIYIEDLYPLW